MTSVIPLGSPPVWYYGFPCQVYETGVGVSGLIGMSLEGYPIPMSWGAALALNLLVYGAAAALACPYFDHDRIARAINRLLPLPLAACVILMIMSIISPWTTSGVWVRYLLLSGFVTAVILSVKYLNYFIIKIPANRNGENHENRCD